jgi:phage terminase large subunit-like protein
MVEDGLPMVTIAQTASHFTLPIIEVENMVLTGQIVHQGSKAVEWMMGNVVMVESKFSGLMHPIKESKDLKIDAPVALLLCAGRALLFKPEPSMDDYVKSRAG